MPRFFLTFLTSLTVTCALAAPVTAASLPEFNQAQLAETVATAAELPRLHALIVAKDGVPIVERVVRGPALDRPVNIKSESKTIMSALVGIAIEKGVLGNVNQPALPLL
jgi:hypothetical protein